MRRGILRLESQLEINIRNFEREMMRDLAEKVADEAVDNYLGANETYDSNPHSPTAPKVPEQALQIETNERKTNLLFRFTKAVSDTCSASLCCLCNKIEKKIETQIEGRPHMEHIQHKPG